MMTTKQYQTLISETLGLSPRNPRDMWTLLDDCCRFHRYGELPVEVEAACYGIAWACETGRVSGQLYMAIKSLKGARALSLIAHVCVSCQETKVCADVPRWLINNSETILQLNKN